MINGSFRVSSPTAESINNALEQVAADIRELDSRNTASAAPTSAALASIQMQLAAINADISALRAGGTAPHGGTHNITSTDPANIEESQVNGLAASLAGKQPIDSTLTAIAALVSAANQLILCTGIDTFSIGPLTDAYVAAANKDGIAGTASMRTLGTGAQQACAGNDSRLSDARTPTAHATSHAPGGGDPITITESQVTNLVTDLAAKEAAANKGAANGYSPLGADSKIPTANLPNSALGIFNDVAAAAGVTVTVGAGQQMLRIRRIIVEGRLINHGRIKVL